MNRSELNRLLVSPSSPVAVDLGKRAQRVAASAKRRAPRKTGALKASIGWQIGEDDQGLYADIGSTVPYARPVEQGHKEANGGRVSPRRFLAARAVRLGQHAGNRRPASSKYSRGSRGRGRDGRGGH